MYGEFLYNSTSFISPLTVYFISKFKAPIDFFTKSKDFKIIISSVIFFSSVNNSNSDNIFEDKFFEFSSLI